MYEGFSCLAQVFSASKLNTKNVDVRYHFIREFIEKGDFSVIHVNSEYQRAEFVTKPLDKSSFAFHRGFVMNMS